VYFTDQSKYFRPARIQGVKSGTYLLIIGVAIHIATGLDSEKIKMGQFL
jgi:hypothetical protein